MEPSSNKIGKKIKRYRLLNDIRQEDMAEQMGVSRATLINYEKGYTTINLDVLNRLSQHYPDFIVGDEDDSKPQIIFDNTIDFKVLFRVLFDSKKYIVLFTFLFMVLGTSLSYLLKEQYQAEISLYPAKKDYSQGLSQFQSIVSNLGINTPPNEQSFNIPDVVMSRLIANQAISQVWKIENGNSTTLADIWKLNKPTWIGKIFRAKIDSISIKEKSIKKFRDHIRVTEDRNSGLIKIYTTFQSPIIASQVANFIGTQVELYIQKENSAQSNKEKIFISERLLIVKSELESSELLLKDFLERNRGYEESPDLFMKYSQLFREVEAKKEVYLMLQQQLELARIDEVKQSPILHILDYAVPPIKKSSPNRFLFLITSYLLGLVFSTLITIYRY